MIVLRLKGGLGNQMFQYASARALALESGQHLQLDTRSGFARDPYGRRYELGRFKITAPEHYGLISRPDIIGAGCWRLARTWGKRLPRAFGLYVGDAERSDVRAVARQSRFSMILAEGCFQDYTLFESIRGLLRKEFVLKQEYLSKDLTKLGRRLQDQETVALHVRAALDMSATGVRVGQPRSLKPQYYQWAVERVLARFPDAVFAVFRDSPSPVQFLPLGQMNLAYLGEGKRPAHEDFYLMTLCRHHIVANSTFSWWAAWLATQEAALVVSPPPHDYGYTIAVPANWNTAA